MYFAGIDIGGTNTVLGLVDAHGEVATYDVLSTKAFSESVESYVDAIADTLSRLVRSSSLDGRVVGIGIGAPNGNYHTGCIEEAANLPWRGSVPLVKLLAERTSLPCILTNDANAIAMGEMIYGAAKGMRHFYEITLGTGVGSGIVVDGSLVYGADGKAGELGHVIVDPEGRRCGCGRVGCLETYCSASGLVLTAKELYGCSCDDPSLTAQRLYHLAEEGDAVAQEAFRRTGYLLGRKLADFATFASPEAIILFGGLTHAGTRLMTPVQEAFDTYMLGAIQKPRLLRSALREESAAILGAAALAHAFIQ